VGPSADPLDSFLSEISKYSALSKGRTRKLYRLYRNNVLNRKCGAAEWRSVVIRIGKNVEVSGLPRARNRVTSHVDGDLSMNCDRSLRGSTTCMACYPNMTLNIAQPKFPPVWQELRGSAAGGRRGGGGVVEKAFFGASGGD